MCEHHISHAASAFLVSPYEEVGHRDGRRRGRMGDLHHLHGERATTSRSSRRFVSRTRWACSTAPYTYYLGFKVNSAEYKVMGLAPYGEPKYVDQVLETIKYNDDGSFKMNMKYFAYDYGLEMTNRQVRKALRTAPARARIQAGAVPQGRGDERAEGHRGDRAAHGPSRARTHGFPEPVHGGRRRAQLRRQRPGPQGDARTRTSSSSPPRVTRAAPWASRRTSTIPSLGNERKWHWQHAYLGPEYSARTNSRLPRLERDRLPGVRRRGHDRRHGAGHGSDQKDDRLVPGTHGVRPARAGRAFDHRGCAQSREQDVW